MRQAIQIRLNGDYSHALSLHLYNNPRFNKFVYKSRVKSFSRYSWKSYSPSTESYRHCPAVGIVRQRLFHGPCRAVDHCADVAEHYPPVNNH